MNPFHLAIALACGLGACGPALAGDQAIEVASAACDSVHRTVRIEGRNLAPRGAAPAIHMEGHAGVLKTLHVTDSAIVARMPSGISDGQYILSLRRGDDALQWREVPVVLGVVGPVVVE